jgi:hypothetical protein
MRSKNRNILVALVAILAFGVVASASASAALPEFSPAGGTGKAAIHFTVSQTGEDQFVSNKHLWSSNGITGTGEITGSKEVSNLVLTYHEIHSNAPCTNGSGSLVTNKLSGHLGYINKAKTEVGLLIEPTTQPIASCSEIRFPGEVTKRELRGSWIGRIGPVNVKTESMSLTYKAVAGSQEPEKFEAELGNHHLEWAEVGGASETMFDHGAESLSHLQKNEEAVALTIVG